VSPNLSHELLDRARTEVRAAVDEARLAVWDLRRGSLNGDRLVPGVSQLAHRIGVDAGLEIGVEIVGDPVGVGSDTEHSLLLLIREALHNAIRHAAARHLSVVLRFDPAASK
jgi:signal transduction histidine kinase